MSLKIKFCFILLFIFFLFGFSYKAEAVSISPSLDIISRAEWDCPEYFSSGDENYWYSDYYPVSAIIIHHTATSDGGDNSSDKVRSIYEGHAITNGWGDIGYNYLIDHLGHIYEGREGGDNVVGGHVLNFNKRTIGIGLIGNYQDNDISYEMHSSLNRFLAYLTQQYGLDSLRRTNVWAHDGSFKNSYIIDGHRSYDATLCPGDILFRLLPQIRQEVHDYDFDIPAEGKLLGKFYQNEFEGYIQKRDLADADISERWYSSPLGSDDFSVRYDGKFSVSDSAPFEFNLEANNQVKLWVDGKLLFSGSSSSDKNYEKKWYLEEGKHDLKIEYFVEHYPAEIHFDWDEKDLEEGEFWGEYYPNFDAAGAPLVVSTANRIDFDWENSSPFSVLKDDYFSARWWGEIKIDKTDDYSFIVTSDDGVELWLDGKRIIAGWGKTEGEKTFIVSRKLDRGSHFIELDYQDRNGPAQVSLDWVQGIVATPTPVFTRTAPDKPKSFQASFFNNPELQGGPSFTTSFDMIEFDWGINSPYSGGKEDRFSVRFEGQVDFQEGDYLFKATADDGIRVWLDHKLIFDEWHPQAAWTYSSLQTLSAGSHSIKIEYQEIEGAAICKVLWEKLDLQEGYLAEYFTNRELAKNAIITAWHNDINFDWGLDNPYSIIPRDNFSIRWTRRINLEKEGDYLFSVTSDDGALVKVDGRTIINAWQPQASTRYKTIQKLDKGEHKLTVAYNEWGGAASINFYYLFLEEGWQGTYFDNVELSDPPVWEDIEPVLDLDWGLNSPDNLLPADNFSARWERNIDIQQDGYYLFKLASDDGSRLFIDNKKIIDMWRPQAFATASNIIYLEAGKYPAQLEYFELGGAAKVRLNWERVESEGYLGEYYSNSELGGKPVIIKEDPKIDFDWGINSPSVDGIDDDNFSVRWRKKITINDVGWYSFLTRSDDGIRVYLDGNILIDQWQPQAAHYYEKERYLEKGTYDLIVEYFELGGAAEVEFSYQVNYKTNTPEPTSESPNTPTAGEPNIRVGIYHVQENTPVVVSSSNRITIWDGKSNLKEVSPGNKISVYYQAHNYYLETGQEEYVLERAPVFQPSYPDSAYIEVDSYQDSNWQYGSDFYDEEIDNYNKFRGALEVRYTESTDLVWIINELPLESYLKGMGEAIDSHPGEYLKTFSVAARSYALAYLQNGGRHPEERITLYNGSGDQIYKGYNRERLSPRISEAIDATKGEVITYNGQVVIVPYFSKSDGRTRDWDEVWPSRSYPLPWCMGKDDPYGTREGVPEGVGRGYPNHGVGMCAAGARGFAEAENRDYLWILNYYYTDISVEKEY